MTIFLSCKLIVKVCLYSLFDDFLDKKISIWRIFWLSKLLVNSLFDEFLGKKSEYLWKFVYIFFLNIVDLPSIWRFFYFPNNNFIFNLTNFDFNFQEILWIDESWIILLKWRLRKRSVLTLHLSNRVSGPMGKINFVLFSI